MGIMQLHEAELVELLTSLCDGDLPANVSLGPDSRHVGTEEAWRRLRGPHLEAAQIVVPVHGGALLLAGSTGLSRKGPHDAMSKRQILCGKRWTGRSGVELKSGRGPGFEGHVTLVARMH
ncbi:hypothetical protein QR90_08635 [Deinococcus radiopugnans]|uniref:Uncharacterized protein n=1 Tax=Deinococcus radiopugnans TaxID=57497 RepID=A0A0A7KIU2_9DEIO|nr:hypothetical protein QR90_08635 [Deinococcus radiopugnans]